ncbi:MAG: PHP domain-containing protein [bacterium]|nr:PHP domain-containing protein [bacterium]
MYCDLHIHTTYSDSSLTPKEVVEEASRIGLTTIAITDHDTVDGIPEAIEWGKKYEIDVIPGIELSTDIGREEVHILGYYIDWENEQFNRRLHEFKISRQKRAHLIINRFKKLGIEIDYKRVALLAGEGIIGRLHIANVLKEQGVVASIKDAFSEYLNYGGLCYVEKFRLTPEEAIEMIKCVGGIPVLAHPYHNRYNNLIPKLIKVGLEGLEIYHPEHSLEIQLYYEKLARDYRLIPTGGSDCHGTMKGGEILLGNAKVRDEIVKRLKRFNQYNQK